MLDQQGAGRADGSRSCPIPLPRNFLNSGKHFRRHFAAQEDKFFSFRLEWSPGSTLTLFGFGFDHGRTIWLTKLTCQAPTLTLVPNA